MIAVGIAFKKVVCLGMISLSIAIRVNELNP